LRSREGLIIPKKKTKTLENEPFDLKKNAMEGIEEALYWHTVGVVEASGSTIGTAVAIRYNKHCVFLTANHVIDETPDENLGFFFRPPGTLKRKDWWQENSLPGRIAPAQRVKIFHRFVSRHSDLAALVVSPLLEKSFNVRFFDLCPTIRLPKPMPSVAAIGFPADTLQNLGPQAKAVTAAPIWGNVETGRHWRPADFRHSDHLLLHFLPATVGRHPGGYSGAGVWYHAPTPKPGIWSPNLALAGIVTHYYPRKQMLIISRVEKLTKFLNKIAPP
jgi:hypothetical protein